MLDATDREIDTRIQFILKSEPTTVGVLADKHFPLSACRSDVDRALRRLKARGVIRFGPGARWHLVDGCRCTACRCR